MELVSPHPGFGLAPCSSEQRGVIEALGIDFRGVKPCDVGKTARRESVGHGVRLLIKNVSLEIEDD